MRERCMGKGASPARRGWAGEKSDFSSFLLRHRSPIETTISCSMWVYALPC
jgi:hypothetical protein